MIFQRLFAGHTLIILQSVLSVLFSLREQLLRLLREELGQRRITRFALDELYIIGGRLLAVQRERILPFISQLRIITVKLPISSFHSLLLLKLRLAHVDAMIDTGSVSDYYGGAVIRFGFSYCFEKLSLIATCATYT